MNPIDQLRRVQKELQTLYALEPAPDVALFVEMDAAHRRETLLLRHDAEGLAVRLLLPALETLAPGLCDRYLQAVEGVSHFLLLAERARRELPTTLLELEMQAEVDKFALLVSQFAGALGPSNDNHKGAESSPRALTPQAVHEWLFERTTFLHPPRSHEGDRYRAANRLAARFWSKLLDAAPNTTRDTLRRFYRAGPHEKIRLAKAV